MVRSVHEMARVMNAVLRIRASIRWHVILFWTDLRSLGNGIGDDLIDIRTGLGLFLSSDRIVLFPHVTLRSNHG